MNRLKFLILIVILITLSSCKTAKMGANKNVNEDTVQDELYYEYDFDYYDQDDFDKG